MLLPASHQWGPWREQSVRSVGEPLTPTQPRAIQRNSLMDCPVSGTVWVISDGTGINIDFRTLLPACQTIAGSLVPWGKLA